MDRRIGRGQATRQHIIDTATRLFTDAGYEAVSIEAILGACGISRGALYHHFLGKEAVFRAVLEATEARIAAHLSAGASEGADPVALLRAGCAAWLDLASTDPTVRRVVLTDAPGVIGWQAWRAMDELYTLGLLQAALVAAARAGWLRGDQVEVFSHMLLAVLMEVALLIARAPEDAAAVDRGHEAVARLLDGMFPSPPRVGRTRRRAP